MGLGVKWAFWPAELVQPGLFGSIQYIDDIEYKTVDGPGEFVYVQPESYLEYNGGLIASHLFKVSSSVGILPYAGVMVSRLDGDEQFKQTWTDGSSDRTRESLRDDGLFPGFAGVKVAVNDSIGSRVEGRFGLFVLSEAGPDAGRLRQDNGCGFGIDDQPVFVASDHLSLAE